LAAIAALRGKQFDPELTDLFRVLVLRLQREVGDLDAYLGQAAWGVALHSRAPEVKLDAERFQRQPSDRTALSQRDQNAKLVSYIFPTPLRLLEPVADGRRGGPISHTCGRRRPTWLALWGFALQPGARSRHTEATVKEAR
jgi:hypothetical protein